MDFWGGASLWSNQEEGRSGSAMERLSAQVASSVKRKSPPELLSGVADSGGLFGGRGIAAARNLMASVGISRAGERQQSIAEPPPPSDFAAMELEQTRRLIATPQFELFEYGGDPSTICGGSVCGGQRVCAVKPGMCSFKHHPKLHDRLAPGFYIRPCVGRGGPS